MLIKKIKIFFFSFAFMLAFSFYSIAQNSIKIGIEPNLNAPFFGDMESVPRAINVFTQWNKNELYGGLDIYSYNLRIFGFEGGYKFHFNRNEKRNHLYLDFNNQYSSWTSGAGPNYNYSFTDINNFENLYKQWTIRSSIGIGYEMYVTNYFSFITSAGPGISYFKGYQNLGQGVFKENRSDFSAILFFKVGLRFTLKLN